MLAAIGIGLQAMGVFNSAIGAYYGAKSQQNQLESGALDFEYQSQVANLNARQAEDDAQFALEQGNQQQSMAGLQYGQAKQSYRAGQGASGVVVSDGSNAEVAASIDLARDIDTRNIRLNATRRANTARGQAQDYRNQANLSAVSANNLRRSARTISPGLAGFSTLLGGASQIAGNWIAR